MSKVRGIWMLAALASCATYPDDWVDPTSATGSHDSSDKDLASYGGRRYRIQWRGDPAAPEQSLWRLRGDELDEQVVPWGPWRSLEVTDDATFFVRERGTDRWLLHRAGDEPTPMRGWNHVFRAVASGFLGHYVLVDDRTAIIRIDAGGRELARVPGDDFELASGGLLVRRGDELLDFYDRDLRPRSTGALRPVEVVGVGRVWIVPTADGLRAASAKTFVGHGPYADLRPLAFGEGRRVEAWAVKRPGDTAYRVADGGLEERTSARFVAVDRAAWISAPGTGEQRRVVVACVDGEPSPWRVLSWDESLRELAQADNLDGALVRSQEVLLAEVRAAEERERAERLAALERAVEEKRAEAQRERERQQQLAEERRQREAAEAEARREFRAALVKGGIPERDIDRYERQGTPLVVVGGKSFAGSRMMSSEGVVYDGGISWEAAPNCFLWWDGKHWQSALKVNTGDGYERVLMQRDGQLQARLKDDINGTYIAPVAAAELLAECGRCGGDGVERQWRTVLVYDRINGYRWEERLLRVGTLVREGNFVVSKKFVPGTCNRCWGHGVEPHIPE